MRRFVASRGHFRQVTVPSVLVGAEKKDTWVANIILGKKEQENVVHELSGAALPSCRPITS